MEHNVFVYKVALSGECIVCYFVENIHDTHAKIIEIGGIGLHLCAHLSRIYRILQYVCCT